MAQAVKENAKGNIYFLFFRPSIHQITVKGRFTGATSSRHSPGGREGDPLGSQEQETQLPLTPDMSHGQVLGQT